ncbi:methyltransferase family protein [Gelidibacter sediminis]|uniref:Methyltransferase family protein n=1 Tax=Gelidibacter sediminis TaxID=1608710 RepID=A0A4R7Q9A4_9FLAO|nr:class I SAM-dependent methyltransferase [Gelidibacter sediminis]TDU43529.1 methyltransferase family protein [Gelidibacter sediminis]
MSNLNHKKVYIKVKDHSVSGENFQLLLNEDMGMLETFPKPSEDRLPEYYKSEDYISHTDAKRNLFEKVYHVVKGIALQRKLKLIESVVPESKSLLDVGCGTGDFLKVASKAGWKVSGIEPNVHARLIANKKTDEAVYDSEHLFKFESEYFDVITLWHVLEHLPNLEEHMAVFNKLLKNNGTLIIAVPNYNSYDASLYKEFWAAYDVPRHLWHFSRNAIKTLATTFDFQVVKTVPMKFDAFYVSLLSEKYKNGYMNFLSGFWNGWLSNLKARQTGEYSSLIYVLKKV